MQVLSGRGASILMGDLCHRKVHLHHLYGSLAAAGKSALPDCQRALWICSTDREGTPYLDLTLALQAEACKVMRT